MQERMGSAEFTEWMAFYATEPWGDVRGDMQNAMLLTLTANAYRDPKRKPFQPSEFLHDYWQPTAEQAAPTPEMLIAKFKALTK